MHLNFSRLIAVTTLLVASLACAVPPQNPASVSNSMTTAPSVIVASYNSKTNRPPTKTATISVEGEKIPITLKLYNEFSNL